MKINVIIAAAGESQRYGKDNKLFAKCGRGCVLTEAVTPFLAFDEVTRVIIATDTSYFDEILSWLSILHLDEDKRITLAIGGKTRTETIKNSIKSLDDDCDIVLTHDGARPYVTKSLIDRVINGVKSHDAAVPLLPFVDNVANVKRGVISADRNDYRAIQTPMGFSSDLFKSAYANVEESFLDDLAVIQGYQDCDVVAVDGEVGNKKITVKTDILTDLVGCGYDIHRLQKGDGIVLCNTPIECQYSLVAHSDGDVAVHAIMDAILSAVGEPDIGHHFPVNDSKYDDIDSALLLAKVLKIAEGHGYRVNNATVAIIAEKPMLAPYINVMRARMSALLGIPAERVGITATTNEKVGDIGDGNAIAAYSTVLLAPII